MWIPDRELSSGHENRRRDLPVTLRRRRDAVPGRRRHWPGRRRLGHQQLARLESGLPRIPRSTINPGRWPGRRRVLRHGETSEDTAYRTAAATIGSRAVGGADLVTGCLREPRAAANSEHRARVGRCESLAAHQSLKSGRREQSGPVECGVGPERTQPGARVTRPFRQSACATWRVQRRVAASVDAEGEAALRPMAVGVQRRGGPLPSK